MTFYFNFPGEPQWKQDGSLVFTKREGGRREAIPDVIDENTWESFNSDSEKTASQEIKLHTRFSITFSSEFEKAFRHDKNLLFYKSEKKMTWMKFASSSLLIFMRIEVLFSVYYIWRMFHFDILPESLS